VGKITERRDNSLYFLEITVNSVEYSRVYNFFDRGPLFPPWISRYISFSSVVTDGEDSSDLHDLHVEIFS